jgi:radical SAM superfamily enzyme YgiQ (UPF0313 family)
MNQVVVCGGRNPEIRLDAILKEGVMGIWFWVLFIVLGLLAALAVFLLYRYVDARNFLQIDPSEISVPELLKALKEDRTPRGLAAYYREQLCYKRRLLDFKLLRVLQERYPVMPISQDDLATSSLCIERGVVVISSQVLETNNCYFYKVVEIHNPDPQLVELVRRFRRTEVWVTAMFSEKEG